MNVGRHHIATRFSLLAVVLLIGNPATAHFDIFLARPSSGANTIIGGADVDELEYDDVTRVFEVEVGAVGSEFLAVDPGVNHPNLSGSVAEYPASAAGLQPGDVLRLEKRAFTVAGVESELFYWNGVGDVSFAPTSAGFRIDNGDPLAASVGPGGAFDAHPFWVVDSDALPGIYLASFYGVVNGFGPSDAAYLVMGTVGLDDLEERLERAADYVYSTLVIPEPASLALAAVAACATAVGRRRRRS